MQADPDDHGYRAGVPGTAGRTLTRFGIGIALAGVAGWLWMTLALLSAVGAGNIPDDAFGTGVGGSSLLSGGFTAIVIGTALAVIGNWVAKAAGRRSYRA